MSREVLLYKVRAFLTSLLVFFGFALCLFFLAWKVWYPDYLFLSDGGFQGLRLVLLVDLVLGPVLALVFFHPEKSRAKLVFDVVVMTVIQVAAMVWGAHQVWSQRPVAVVYGSERFVSVAPRIMALQFRDEEKLSVYSPDRPSLVYRREPVNLAEKQQMTRMIFAHGFHPESQAWLFQPFRENLDKVFTRQQAFHVWMTANLEKEWGAWSVGRSPAGMGDYRFALFEGRYSNALLIFSKEGHYVDYLPVEGPLPVIVDIPPQPKVQEAGTS